MVVRGLAVGPVQENCYVFAADDSPTCVVVDPGDEVERILEVVSGLDRAVEAILLTHCHFDHIGAVAPLARQSGAPVWCPEIEQPLLADIMSYVPWPGFGPFESYEADHLLSGGEKLTLAGVEIEVLFTPGHSPGHLTFAIESAAALFSGDVLFRQSIGRTDLPGADHETLLASIAALLGRYPDESTVFPGHMGITTLGAERVDNPFLASLVG